MIESVFKSMTATYASPEQATNARVPPGSINTPPEPWPMVSRLTSFFDGTSKITSSGPAEISANLPSGVNFRRFAPRALAASVAVTFFASISITEIVPSPAFATHACFRSGETSKPSEPRPTGTTVSFQSPPGGPGGGPPGRPGVPGEGAPGLCDGGGPGGSAPGGPGGMPAGPSVLSRIVTVAELTLVVTIRFSFGKT